MSVSTVDGTAGEDRRGVRILVALIGAAVLARLFALTFLRPLNWDEIEFFRASDWIRQGLVPFRDFWEHHTPLQWFLFAPVTALTSSEGASAIILMRWAQIPLWIATFWLINRWMTSAGLNVFARWAAMAVALCSSLFMLPAIEFRVDVLGCLCYVAGLVLLQRMGTSRAAGVWAGVAFCLAGWANLRLGPLLAITVLLRRVMRTGERKWEGDPRANYIFAGVIASFVVVLSYFFLTGSAAQLYRQAWQELYIGNRYAEFYPGVFLHRLVAPFGLRPLTSIREPIFEPASFDLGGVLILVIGTWGLAEALRRWRRPDEMFYLAFLQVSNVAFVWAMKSIHNYHFLIIVVLMIPFMALVIDRHAASISRRRAVVAVLAIAALISGGAAILRGKELDLQYQDFVMRETQRRTPPEAKIFDGVGWALRREPAYRYWFLPELARQLEQNGHIERFDAPEFFRAAPAAVITDRNATLWIRHHPALEGYLTTHYIPVWRNIWMPGMSALIAPQRPRFEWLVPADGPYRVIASPSMAGHPWFRFTRLDVGSYDREDSVRIELRLSDYGDSNPDLIRWSIDGQPVVPRQGVLMLRRGQLVAAEGSGMELAVMLLRGDDEVLFRQPRGGATLDAAARPITHVPDFNRLMSIFRP
jgi:hypothetical protein